jgi:hypothetical protein
VSLFWFRGVTFRHLPTPEDLRLQPPWFSCSYASRCCINHASTKHRRTSSRVTVGCASRVTRSSVSGSTGSWTRSASSMSAKACRSSGGRSRVSAIAAWISVKRSADTSAPATASAKRWRSQVSKGAAGSSIPYLMRWSARPWTGGAAYRCGLCRYTNEDARRTVGCGPAGVHGETRALVPTPSVAVFRVTTDRPAPQRGSTPRRPRRSRGLPPSTCRGPRRTRPNSPAPSSSGRR